jgi:hypothetical protein
MNELPRYRWPGWDAIHSQSRPERPASTKRPPRYRPPRQSSYAKAGWWAGHGAELIGAVAGLIVGFVVAVALEAIAPAGNYGWLPWLGLVVGAFGLRAVVGRQFRR